MSAENLEGKLAELTEERFRLRFRSATESIENPMRFRAIRREIARIQTILTEKSGHGKPGTRPKKGKARDEHGAKTGDTVRIMETRPLAKTVNWRVTEIVERAK